MILVIVSKALYSSEGSYDVIVKAFSSFLNFFFFLNWTFIPCRQLFFLFVWIPS